MSLNNLGHQEEVTFGRGCVGNDIVGDLVGFSQFKSVGAWLERGLARPAVQRGLNIPKRP